MKKQIGVIGDSEATVRNKKLAFEVGSEVARQNGILICGGRKGIMEAACQGAKKENGTTVAILPSDSKEDANQYCDIRIPTNMGWTRNSLVVLASDGLIIIGGNVGTLSEVAYGWMYQKPMVSMISADGLSAILYEKELLQLDKLRPQNHILVAESGIEAVTKLFGVLGHEKRT